MTFVGLSRCCGLDMVKLVMIFLMKMERKLLGGNFISFITYSDSEPKDLKHLECKIQAPALMRLFFEEK